MYFQYMMPPFYSLAKISWGTNAFPCESMAKLGWLPTWTVECAVNSPHVPGAGLVTHCPCPPQSAVTQPCFSITWCIILTLALLGTIVAKISRAATLFTVCPMISTSAVAVASDYITTAMLCALAPLTAVVTVVTRFTWVLTGVTMVTRWTGARKGAIGLRAGAAIKARVWWAAIVLTAGTMVTMVTVTELFSYVIGQVLSVTIYD